MNPWSLFIIGVLVGLLLACVVIALVACLYVTEPPPPPNVRRIRPGEPR